jgi:hypothetical protein
MPTLADRSFRVVSAVDPYGRILGFLDRLRNVVFLIKGKYDG